MVEFRDEADDKLPLIVDGPSQELAKLISLEGMDRAGRKLRDLLTRIHGQKASIPDGISGLPATNFLSELIANVGQEIGTSSQGYSSARWLWYIRRLPDAAIAGRHPTTLGYDRTLMENLTWFSRKTESADALNQVRYRVDASSARHILGLLTQIKFLAHLHTVYRRVGKGAGIHFENGVPFAEQSEHETAISIYDERMGKSEAKFTSLGIVGPSTRLSAPSENVKDPHLVMFDSCAPLILPMEVPRHNKGSILANVRVRFIFHSLRAEELIKPYGPNSNPDIPFLAAIEPLVVLLTLLPALTVELPGALSTAMQVGYWVASAPEFERAFSAWITSVREILTKIAPEIDWSSSYGVWLTRIQRIEPTLWPLKSGGCLRFAKDILFVDVAAASRALRSLLVVDRSAFQLSNVRAEVFEKEVQATLSRSPWRPHGRTEEMRGRTLRRQGKALTDIDAIGERGSALLLVSCKSAIYDAEYDRGTFGVVRNIRIMVDRAVENWMEVIADLERNPAGDNFDFSKYTKIIGVVCTPFVVYTESDLTLSRTAEGLRWCSAPFELEDWVNGADNDNTLG